MDKRTIQKTRYYYEMVEGGRIGDLIATYVVLRKWKGQNPDSYITFTYNKAHPTSVLGSQIDIEWLFGDVADEIWISDDDGKMDVPEGIRLHSARQNDRGGLIVDVWTQWSKIHWARILGENDGCPHGFGKEIPAVNKERAAAVLKEMGVKKPFVVVQPLLDAEYNTDRNSPSEWWEDVCVSLRDKCEVVVIGRPDLDNLFSLPDSTHGAYRHGLSVMDTMALVKEADVFVGGETGFTLWAAFCGVRVVACYKSERKGYRLGFGYMPISFAGGTVIFSDNGPGDAASKAVNLLTTPKDFNFHRKAKGSVAIYDKYGDHVRPYIGGMVENLTADRHKVKVLGGIFYHGYMSEHHFAYDCVSSSPLIIDRNTWRYELEGLSRVFMWNGNDIPCMTLKEVCNEMGIPWSVVEVGWFPQSKFWTIDPDGINANSSLMRDDLSWITDEHMQKMQQFREQYIGNKKWVGGGGYILVPLQLDHDSNIVLHSPFKSMQEFIYHCENKFKDEKLVFKIHPKFGGGLQGNGRSYMVTNGNFLDIAQNASLVYGINSTCLLEAAMAGAPVEAVGDGFLRAHGHQKEKLLAALVDKQIPVGDADIDRWLNPILRSNPRPPQYPDVEVPRNGRTDFVMAAYKIDDELIRNFLRWNESALRNMDVRLIIVTDRHIGWLPDWAKCVIYPEVEKISLPALINFGIRRSSAEYVVKTDVDIFISQEAIANILRVKKGFGLSAVYKYVNKEELNTIDWNSAEQGEGSGAFFAMYRGDWYKLRGYNENLVGWGMDDEDMLARAIAFLDDFRVEDIGPVFHVNHPDRRGSSLWPSNWHKNRGSLHVVKRRGYQPIYDGIPVPKDDAEWNVEKDAALAVT